MRRDVAFQDLSRDHHAALVHARALRRAAERETVSEKPVADAFLAYWRRDLELHFAEEEQILAAVATPPAIRALFDRMVADHVWLRTELVELETARAAGADLRPLMGEVGRMLDAHIRFEESSLFEALQAAVDRHDLDHVHEHSHAFRTKWRGPEACSTPINRGH